MDTLEIGEAGPGELLPLTKRRDLRAGDIRSRWRVEILCALGKPLDKRSASRLARRCRGKEDLLQHGVSLERRITEVPRQTRFFEVHDVLAAARGGPDENHPAEDRGAVERHLLRDHSAERESEHVAALQP